MNKVNFTKKEVSVLVSVLSLLVLTGGTLTTHSSSPPYSTQIPRAFEGDYLQKTQAIRELSIPHKVLETNTQTQTTDLLTSPVMPKYNIPLSEKYQSLIWDLCLQNQISYELVLAVMIHENKTFDCNAININNDGTKDYGLFQINTRSINDFKNFAIEFGNLPETTNFDVMNPEDNIRAGIGGLAHLSKYYRDNGVSEENLIYYILGAYNQGKTGYSKYVSRNKYVGTKYAEEVLYLKNKLEQM